LSQRFSKQAYEKSEIMGGGFSFVHWALVILVIVLLFGRGKISDLMGDVAKGIKSFKEGLADLNEEPAKNNQTTSNQAASQPKSLDHEPGATVDVKRAGEERKAG
jgi:sec-independent protein translocase protein TatA